MTTYKIEAPDDAIVDALEVVVGHWVALQQEIKPDATELDFLAAIVKASADLLDISVDGCSKEVKESTVLRMSAVLLAYHRLITRREQDGTPKSE